MNCVKLPGQRLMSRDFDRQVAEVQVRAAVLNRFHGTRYPDDRGRRISVPGERGIAAIRGFAQQRRSEQCWVFGRMQSQKLPKAVRNDKARRPDTCHAQQREQQHVAGKLSPHNQPTDCHQKRYHAQEP